MSKKQILLINDIAGYGKVATAAMLPILSYFGHPTYNLPTALVSNTLDYGKFNIMDTTSYIRGVFPVWKELGFTFDAIATGFIVSEEQAAIVSRYCLEQAATGTTIFVDPIMGDEGKLYNGVTPAAIKSMREMLSVAHLCYPNYTEACYLTDSTYNQQGVGREEAYHLLDLKYSLTHYGLGKQLIFCSFFHSDCSHFIDYNRVWFGHRKSQNNGHFPWNSVCFLCGYPRRSPWIEYRSHGT